MGLPSFRSVERPDLRSLALLKDAQSLNVREVIKMTSGANARLNGEFSTLNDIYLSFLIAPSFIGWARLGISLDSTCAAANAMGYQVATARQGIQTRCRGKS